MKTFLGRELQELILMLTVVKGWQKNDDLGLCSCRYCLQRTTNHILVLTMTENWRQFYKQVIFGILHENSHIFKTRFSITMKLSGNVPNRILVTPAKFEELNISRKSYVKISILGPFFFLTHPVYQSYPTNNIWSAELQKRQRFLCSACAI